MTPSELVKEYQSKRFPPRARGGSGDREFRFAPRPTWQKEPPMPWRVRIRKALYRTRQGIANLFLRRSWCASFNPKGGGHESVPACERATKEDRENMKTILDDFSTQIDSDGERS